MAHKAVVRVITVTTAGDPVQISASQIFASGIYFEARDTNSGKIYVGPSTVAPTAYIAKLAAGENLTVDGPSTRGTEEAIDLSDYWVDASADGQIVMVTTLEKQ